MGTITKPPVAVYSALADACRCRIVEILAAGPLPVHRITEAFTISRPAISRHLRVLKQAGLVAEVKKGRENLYALRPARLGKATLWLETFGKDQDETAPEQQDAAPPPLIVVSPPPAAPEPPPEPVIERVQPAPLPEIAAPAMPEAAPLPVPPPKQPQSRARKPEPANQMGFDF